MVFRAAFIENLRDDQDVWWLKYAPPDWKPDVFKVQDARVLRGLLTGLRYYLGLAGYDVIVTQQDGICTFLYAFVGSLLRNRKWKLVVNEFITTERRPGVPSTLKYASLRFLLRSVDCFLCSARGEADYYSEALGLPPTRFRFIPLATTPRYLGQGTLPPRDFVLSAGRTGRDYETLVRAADGQSFRLVIVPGNASSLPSPLPVNVEVIANIPKDDLDALIQQARVVAVPLQSQPISIGQSVIVHAMARARPVIATRLNATIDYIRHDETGILVRPGDHEDLRAAILGLLTDGKRAQRLAQSALRFAERELVMPRRLERIREVLEEVAQCRRVPPTRPRE